MSKKDERIKKLVEILQVRSYVPVRELAQLLEVSEMTVRRDLRVLESNAIAENVSGMSVYNPAHLGLRDSQSYSLDAEEEKQMHQKEAIGKYAAAMVEPGDLIVIDTGTTTVRIVPYLPVDYNLSVLCYNINILMELRRNPGVNMMFAGGYYQANTQMFASEEGVRFIRSNRAQKAFLSAAGVHLQMGLTCANNYEVPTKKAILRSSLQKILVADSSKFDMVRSSYFCGLEELDDIVTDEGLSADWRRSIGDLGIRLHIV